MPGVYKEVISIIVCTYNRSEILKYCLDSLENQSVDKSNYEVIVVDNNSTDNTKEVIEEYCRRNSNFRYVFEENQGLSHARNRGAKEAKSEWTGYVDDDGKVRENYIEQALYTIENFDFDCFGGKVVNWFKYGKPRWYPEIHDIEKEGISEIKAIEGYVSGGIAFYKKEVIFKYGMFPVNMGMYGNNLGYGEETYLQMLIKKNGSIGFNPFVILDHAVSEKKLSLIFYLKRNIYYGEAYENIYHELPSGVIKKSKILLDSLKKTLIWLFKNSAKFLSNKDYFYQNLIIDSFSELLFNVGRLKAKKGEEENV